MLYLRAEVKAAIGTSFILKTEQISYKNIFQYIRAV
jgi:hypothetical protein